ncbi:hypothetical protein ACJA3J_14970 [Halobacillus sp. SY10]|uniref:hypothetical protein n=1 Tax=Halobacillus sp. SY10 TaxID=3381356 RepID=UPI003879D8D0
MENGFNRIIANGVLIEGEGSYFNDGDTIFIDANDKVIVNAFRDILSNKIIVNTLDFQNGTKEASIKGPLFVKEVSGDSIVLYK